MVVPQIRRLISPYWYALLVFQEAPSTGTPITRDTLIAGCVAGSAKDAASHISQPAEGVATSKPLTESPSSVIGVT